MQTAPKHKGSLVGEGKGSTESVKTILQTAGKTSMLFNRGIQAGSCCAQAQGKCWHEGERIGK